MVDLVQRNRKSRESLDRATKAIADALAEGVGERELLDMVTTVATDITVEQPEIPGMFLDVNEQEIIYTEDEVPEGLIDLPSAAQKYNCPVGTLQTWVKRGHLKTFGRLKAPARGGGYVLLLEADVLDRATAPLNKGGRPRKTPAPT